MRFSSNIHFLEPSPTLALQARARALAAQGHSIVDLSAGEPSFGTPAVAVEGALTAIQDGKTGYPPTQGIPGLRAAICTYLEETTRHGRPTPADILVSAGVKQALFNILYCLAQSGDEVILPTPNWPTYGPLIRLAGAQPVLLRTRWEDGFRIDPDELERLRTPRTRVLLINSPRNPTGTVIPVSELEDLLNWSDRHGVWLLSDEIYRRFAFVPGGAASVYDISDRPERVVLLDGVSKTFSMTGWRIGFAVGPQAAIAKATALQSQTTSGAAAPSQYAAEALYSRAAEREATVDEFSDLLSRRRTAGHTLLARVPGLDTPLPDGAIFYYSRLIARQDSLAVAEELLIRAGVACIPGEPFGSPGFLRFNFSVRDDVLEEGIRRLQVHFLDSAG